MHRFLPITVLLFHSICYGQIDQQKLDSLSKLIDSSAKAGRLQQERTIRVVDSSYHSELNKALQKNVSNTNQLSVEQKSTTAKEKQQTVLRNLILVGLLIIAALALARKRKQKPNSPLY